MELILIITRAPNMATAGIYQASPVFEKRKRGHAVHMCPGNNEEDGNEWCRFRAKKTYVLRRRVTSYKVVMR